MLAESLERLARQVPDDALVLDVGGWARPLPRADWVIDLLPYGTRGLYGAESEERERFTEATWVQRDICAREAWPFTNGQFDFVVCSHTLEDIRDPIWACDEMVRVARGGYIEAPSRLEEQSQAVQGPWTGWAHHRWLIDKDERGLRFVIKLGTVHARDSDRFPPGFHKTLSPRERVVTLWWEESFGYREEIFVGDGDVDEYLSAPIRDRAVDRPRRWRR